MVKICKLKDTWLCPYYKSKVPKTRPQCIIRIGTLSNCKYFKGD